MDRSLTPSDHAAHTTSARRSIAAALVLCAVLSITSASCSAMEGDAACFGAPDSGSCGEPPGMNEDATVPRGDTGTPPPPPAEDGGVRDQDGNGPSPADAGAAQPEQAALCLDGLDNDADGALDCADPQCGLAAACCVDNALCCGEPRAILALDFAACASGAPPSSCAAVREIGDVASVVSARDSTIGVSVGGDLRADNGVVANAELAADGAIALRAELDVLASDCGGAGACAESITIGLVDGQPAASLSPWVAVTLSLDLLRAVLVVDGRVAATTDVTGIDGPLSVALDVTADGAVVAVLRAGETEIARSTAATDASPAIAYAAAWGRAANVPSSRVLVRRIDVDARACDRPRAMSSADPIRVQGSAPLEIAATPSFALDTTTGTTAGVVVIDGVVRGGLYDLTDGARTLELDADPWLAAPGERITSADLVHVPADLGAPWWLFVTIEPSDGRAARVALARSAAPGMFEPEGSLTDLAGDLRSTDTPPEADLGDVDAIAYEGGVYVVYRADTDDGAVVYAMTMSALDGARSSRGVILQPGESSDAFDRDGVSSPSLLVYRGLLHLFYTGRRGTSASVGYLYSADGFHWPRYEGGPVIAPSGNVLSTTDPEAFFFPDDALETASEGTLEIAFTTSDGARRTLGSAQRRVFVGVPGS